MRAPARGVARLLSGAGLAAALLLPAAVPAHAAPLSRTPTADGKKGQELPGMPSALDPDAEEVTCTLAS
ncbi:S8 family serine peptidase, partial [Streptomyces sp. 2A115]